MFARISIFIPKPASLQLHLPSVGEMELLGTRPEATRYGVFYNDIFFIINLYQQLHLLAGLLFT
jgi:hypothetical protein